MTGLSINQDINSDVVVVPNVDKQEAISNLIQKLVKEKKNLTLALKSTVRKHLKK